MREILIQSIFIDSNTIEIKPTNCPGKDRKDILLDSKNNPCCVYNLKVCKYLDEVFYEVDKHEESLYCKIP